MFHPHYVRCFHHLVIARMHRLTRYTIPKEEFTGRIDAADRRGGIFRREPFKKSIVEANDEKVWTKVSLSGI